MLLKKTLKRIDALRGMETRIIQPLAMANSSITLKGIDALRGMETMASIAS